jgi:nitroimidazol reductase NimA-like FMN-containing flavoprotein (pyridoxamine 5'-phosphate oxidase superfamily)
VREVGEVDGAQNPAWLVHEELTEHAACRGTGTRLESTICMIGELSPSQIEQLLHEQVVGRIGCHSRGRTYVVPVTYAYVDGAILSHTGNGLKVQMMRENPSVCFEVEDLHLPQWSSVIVQGRYEELSGADADAALERLEARLGATPPSMVSMPRQGAGIYEPVTRLQRPEVVFRIAITDKTGRYDR